MPAPNPHQLDQSVKNKKRSPISWIFRNGSLLLAALTPFLFLTGWFYLMGYYTFFHLNLLTLDLPFHATLLASLDVLVSLLFGLNDPWFLVKIGLGLLAIIAISWLLEKLKISIKDPNNRSFLATVVFVYVFWFGWL